MAKIVPLISSSVAGPLGVLHLPRLDEMVEGGLVTLEKVRVILYRANQK